MTVHRPTCTNLNSRVLITCWIVVLPCTGTLHATESPAADALRSAIASQAPPRLEWSGKTQPTISVTRNKADIEVSGRCRNGRPVVISGRGVREPIRVDCIGGAYTARPSDGSMIDPSQEIVATQVVLEGSIFAARHLPAATPQRDARVTPGELPAALNSAKPGERILLAPGTYSDVAVSLPQGKGGAPGHPVVIDGNHAVTFTGSSRISIDAGHMTLRGLGFREVGPGAAVTISGPKVRITESKFTGCGDAHRPKSECLIVTMGGAEAELDFNTFAGSKSMSVKVRAGPDFAPNQPANVSIHHNVFRDIRRLSDNGQEPIQIAGPGGGGSETLLKTRIEHNLFYRAEGDREAVSMKGPGTLLRWNVFRDMDAAPNLRGSRETTIAENILIRTRPIRIAGKNHRVIGNILLCPINRSSGIIVSHGSPGYGVAANNVVRDNIVAGGGAGIAFAAQTQPVEATAHGNQITGNAFYLPKSAPALKLQPDSAAREIAAANTLAAAGNGAELCPKSR